MEQIPTRSEDCGGLWRIWVDKQRHIVSFHEEAGFQLIEFHSQELFWKCIDQYVTQRFRYQ